MLLKTNMQLNFGPQHPAAHGLLRLLLKLEGETVVNVEPYVGFLHRGVEKIAESKNYWQIIPFIDRLDYVSALCNEHAYILAVEKLFNIVPPIRAKYIRVLYAEITRILSHLLWLGSHALDIGAMSVFLYCMQEREKLLDCYEILGSRMHPNYYCPGGVLFELPEKMADGQLLYDYILNFVQQFPERVAEFDKMLTNNRIWQRRTIGVGVINKERALRLGFTGPMLRASGVNWDLRKQQPYEVYSQLEFNVPVEIAGDCFARYLVHLEEMRQSISIIKQCVSWLQFNPGEIQAADNFLQVDKIFSKKPHLFCGEIYQAIEHPKGEFGVYLLSDGKYCPYRIKIRSASFPHIAALNELARGHLVADLAAIVSSTDVMLSEVDR